MSVTPREITINIVAPELGVETLEKVQQAIHLAIIKGIRACLKAAIDLAERIVPESAERSPPYPPSYESEALMESYISVLRDEVRRLFSGSRTLQDRYTIQQDWEASYAEFVNEMVGVNWSKAGSISGFIEILDFFIRANLERFIQNELRSVQTAIALLSVS